MAAFCRSGTRELVCFAAKEPYAIGAKVENPSPDLLTALVGRRSGHFDSGVLVQRMVEVEVALALAQAAVGVIPEAAAQSIENHLSKVDVTVFSLAGGVLQSGVPVPALISKLREFLPEEVRSYLHWGATSQDIVDTATVLCIARYLRDLDEAIVRTGDGLAIRMQAERHTAVLSHTRFQQAVPTVLGLRFAGWLAPLSRYRQRMAEMRSRLLVLQFGGAAGNLAALGEDGQEVAVSFAKRLDLGLPAMPWHSQRDAFFELASLAAGLSGHLAKIGIDVLLAAQNEVGEMQEANGGGSSTMPNKSNPVRAEALLTIGRLAGGKLASMQGSLIHAQERDGAAWATEWAVLPELLDASLHALNLATELLDDLVIDRHRMADAITSNGSFALAEAASFVLSREMPRSDAQTLVKRAAATARGTNTDLFEALAAIHRPGIDKAAVIKLATELPTAQKMIDQVAQDWRRQETC